MTLIKRNTPSSELIERIRAANEEKQLDRVAENLLGLFKYQDELKKLSDGELIDLAWEAIADLGAKEELIVETLLDRFQNLVKLEVTPKGRTTGSDSYEDVEEDFPLNADILV